MKLFSFVFCYSFEILHILVHVMYLVLIGCLYDMFV
jgi:hypothetical protein